MTPEGALVREVLPHFDRIWRGDEPDISILGRIREARAILAMVAGRTTNVGRDCDTSESGAAFETELEASAPGVELRPALAARLAQYRYVTPW